MRRSRWSMVAAYLLLTVSLLASIWAWRSNRAHALDRARTRLQQEMEHTEFAIRARLEVYEDGMYGTRSFFEANDVVTRQMFRDYVDHLALEQRYPGIQGIGFAEHIAPADKQAHEAHIRAEGYPQYTITPPGQRADYTAIVYLEPFNWRNQRAFGYDMFSEPVRRAAMQYARDNGVTGISSKVTLVQETDQDVQPGFLMYLPLYRKGAPVHTVAERRAALLGYIYSPFRMRNFMHELTPETTPLAHFEIYSGTQHSPESLLYREAELDRLPPGYKPAYVQTGQIFFGGEIWSVRYVSSPGFDATVREGENRIILPAGVAISLLIFGVLISVSQTEQRALRLADTITARLRESEERVRAITETATDAIVSTDADGRIVYFNLAAENIFRCCQQDVVGKHVGMLFPERSRPRERGFEGLMDSRAGNVVGTTVETVARRADGSEFPVSASLSSWRADGTFFTAILRDVTEQKRAADEILQLNERLTEALYRSEKLAISGRLIATIAHEINNPLEALTNVLFVLQSHGEIGPENKELVRLAQDQVAVLSNISRQTLASYREGQFPVATNVSELLDDILALLRLKLMAANVEVRREYPDVVEIKVYPSELRQVFINLIANAIDAMPNGGTLTVSVRRGADRVYFSVADSGCGIAPAQLAKIFDPFFTTKAEKGNGVGLWVVNEIVRKIGGKIEVATSVDSERHGTTFTVSLPTTAVTKTEQRSNSTTVG